jgi:hypothetical protein
VIVALVTVLAGVPVHTAATLPAGETALHLQGGFTLLDIGVPALAVLPVLTGDAELAHGLAPGLDVRARYTTHLGIVHRLGAELRVEAFGDGSLIGGARVFATGSIGGAANDGVDAGGDVATTFAVLLTARDEHVAFTLDSGITMQWLVYELADGNRVDAVPYFYSVDVAIELEWLSENGSLSARIEATIPTAPSDPFTLGGVVPRLLFGGSLLL